jgi:hypothetical protein
VFDGKEEGKFAERLNRCTKVVQMLVQGVMENSACSREGVDGREVGNELWFSESEPWQTVLGVKNCLAIQERCDEKNQLRG